MGGGRVVGGGRETNKIFPPTITCAAAGFFFFIMFFFQFLPLFLPSAGDHKDLGVQANTSMFASSYIYANYGKASNVTYKAYRILT